MMNCKNCNFELNVNDKFCNNCGAKVIKERITIKSLFSYLLSALGWDSNFFITLRYLISNPQIIIKEYINGTRKKYSNPFTFFAISLAISLFVFNQYSEQFVLMSTYTQQTNEVKDISPSITNNNDTGMKLLGFKNQEEFNRKFAHFQLRHYNLISFLYLPLFTLIAFLVFKKPYNYGEHLVINTYFSAVTTFFGVLIFIVSLVSKTNLLLYSTLFTFIYYSYAYKKIYELSNGKILLKILKFAGILFIVMIIIIILSIIILLLLK